MLNVIRVFKNGKDEQKILIAKELGTLNAFINVVYNDAKAIGVDSADIRVSSGNRNARSVDGRYYWTAVEA